MSRWRAAGIVLLVTLAIDVGTAQVAKRYLPQWHSTMPASNPRTISPIYHHGLRPMMDVKTRVGPALYDFATNSLGMVDARPRHIDPQANECRYLIVGDSFTEGFGVGWDKSFVGLLSKRWRINGVDVLNAGVVSYSPTIYYRKVKHLIEDVKLQFGAALVMIDVGDASDEWRSYDLDAAGNVTPIGHVWKIRAMDEPNWRDYVRYWVQDNSVIAQVVKDIRQKLRKPRPPAVAKEPPPPPVPHRPPIKPPLGEVEVPPPMTGAPKVPPGLTGTLGVENGRWTLDEDAWTSWGRNGLVVAAERMDRLVLLLRQHGIRLTVAVYPWPDQVFAGDQESAQRRFWRDWARSRQVDFVDLFPPFFTDEDRLATVRRYFTPGDFHWNAEGNALIAQRLDQAIEPRRACR